VKVCAVMQSAYPELDEQIQHIKEVIQREEERFGRTLKEVLPVLNEYLAPLRNEQRQQRALAELTASPRTINQISRRQSF